MKKQEYLEKLNRLGLDRERFCIISGGVMLLYGLREETQDIDIKMSPAYFEEVRSRFSVRKSPKYDYLYEFGDDVEVAVQEYDQGDVRTIDGFQVESLEKQLEWKVRQGRQKDALDIKLIREYLQSQQ